MDSKVMQKLMGHSNVSITLNIYTHVMEGKMDSELEKFGFANTIGRKGVAKIARTEVTSHSRA